VNDEIARQRVLARVTAGSATVVGTIDSCYRTLLLADNRAYLANNSSLHAVAPLLFRPSCALADFRSEA